MTKYDFNQVIPRKNTNSYKWDIVADDIIPLWVADMDFEVAPEIKQAIIERANHGIFGYTLVPDSYYESIIQWFKNRHNWSIDRNSIIYTSGVVPAISATIKALAMPGENVLVQTPVYNCFFSSIRNQGCSIIENELIREGDTYKINFEDFEKKCADEKTTIFLLCNPHNPTGRVWTKDELERMNSICLKYGVKVISDEIHCELVMPGYSYTPFASISDECKNNSIILNSPSKAFNIAGLQIANIICENTVWRRRINRAINIFEICDVNPFGIVALQAAYNKGGEWIDELNQYIYENYLYLKKFILEELPQVEVIKLEGTYLAWIDIMCFELSSDEAYNELLNDGKVLVNSGTLYGKKSGEGYLRINLACPRETLKKGLIRIARILGQYIEEESRMGCPM
ncbi:MalY/PatB family protein [Segatella albensis]|jgi:cystathionine beta-lyase|uniref:MalY/PatB family protein n=1 Tax=Segatella albensis TaxID=77768 RepID=UPI000415C9DC|nr:MalY/PatB family protein [Segatella albensis]